VALPPVRRSEIVSILLNRHCRLYKVIKDPFSSHNLTRKGMCGCMRSALNIRYSTLTDKNRKKDCLLRSPSSGVVANENAALRASTRESIRTASVHCSFYESSRQQCSYAEQTSSCMMQE